MHSHYPQWHPPDTLYLCARLGQVSGHIIMILIDIWPAKSNWMVDVFTRDSSHFADQIGGKLQSQESHFKPINVCTFHAQYLT